MTTGQKSQAKIFKAIEILLTLGDIIMEVQYIYNQEGRRTGVIVPIDLWDRLSRLAEECQEEDKGEWDPSKYRGMYKDLKVDVKKESKALRDEWTRI